MKQKKRLLAGIGFLVLGILVLIVARYFHGFSEWYATKIYPVFVESFGRFSGLFPFSVVEALLYILIVIIIVMATTMFRKKCFCDFFANAFIVASVLFFLYCFNCGVNYYRISFAESEGYDVESYSIEDLRKTCEWLTEKVNVLSSQVKRDNDGIMYLDVNEQEEAVKAMTNLGERYPKLSGYYPRPKALWNHWILSVQQLSGIYSPFTIEANYNGAMTDYNIPLTTCHELSHLKGFMQEEEANFIAFLACLQSEETVFQYGGYLLGWIHCMNLLYRTDYEAWEEIRENLSANVEPDLKANSDFWGKYDGAVAEVADRINDTYLKANGQKDGVESYGRMADLIVIYYLKNMKAQ